MTPGSLRQTSERGSTPRRDTVGSGHRSRGNEW